MAKFKSNIPAVSQAAKDIKNGRLLPVYLFFGEDTYTIDNCLKLLEEKISPFIGSDFDKETFYGEDKNMLDIVNFASSFPFGSEKKLVIIKEFEKIRDKKNLTHYLDSPPDFSFLVMINGGTISNPDSEPFKKLAEKGYIFEAKELKGNNLIDWLLGFAEFNGKILTHENAQFLVDLVGENRTMLEAQLEKIMVFLGDTKEITVDVIRSLSTALKEYTIFDLQNALSKKSKEDSLKIALSLLEKGSEPVFIIHMLTRYFTGLTRVNELKEKNLSDQAAARIVGTHPYYYKDYLRARTVYSDGDLYKIAAALLKADMSVKTTTTDDKSIISLLIAEILS